MAHDQSYLGHDNLAVIPEIARIRDWFWNRNLDKVDYVKINKDYHEPGAVALHNPHPSAR
jgi:hypothetical protein